MRERKKRIFAILILLTILLTAGPARQAAVAETGTAADSAAIPDIEAGIALINKAGNIVLTISPASMEALGYEPADIILVKIDKAEMAL